MYRDLNAVRRERLSKEMVKAMKHLMYATYRLGALDSGKFSSGTISIGGSRPTEADSKPEVVSEPEFVPEMNILRDFTAIMRKAVEREDYETAAKFRDLIKGLAGKRK